MKKIEFLSTLSPQVRETILAKLQTLEETENIRILFAVESGSRAWGFPSPDSDYDVRFIYARSTDWYLSITPGRDVIELPIIDELDINGWDIKKALGLLLKSNPILLEWLSSPIRYRWDEQTCQKLIEFSKHVNHSAACLHHYFHLGESLWKKRIANEHEVKLKRYFYVLRPAMALRWLRMKSDTAPPMNFQELMAEVDLAPELIDQLLAILEAKSKTKELGTAARIKPLDDFIQSELDLARIKASGRQPARRRLRNEADEIFRQIIKAGK